MIIFPFSDCMFTFEKLCKLKSIAEMEYYNYMNTDSNSQLKIAVAMVQGSALHLLEINDINPINL